LQKTVVCALLFSGTPKEIATALIGFLERTLDRKWQGVGGGLVTVATALAVPLIDRIGLPAFTIATAAVTGALIAWGIKRVESVELKLFAVG
jgi:hypothetical protein